jgi:hypothetical protein
VQALPGKDLLAVIQAEVGERARLAILMEVVLVATAWTRQLLGLVLRVVVVGSGPAFGRGAAVRKGRDDGRVDLSRFKGEAGARAGFHRAVWGRR